MNQNSAPKAGFNVSEPSFEGRRAVVTGGARGLGKAVALTLAAKGAKVVIWDGPEWPDSPMAYPLSTSAEVERAGEQGLGAFSVDVRDLDQVRHTMSRTVDLLGGIDMVVCAAGVRTTASAATMTDQEWDAVIDTNLHGTFHVLRETLPHLEASGHGRAVVISADEGRRGSFAHSHYSAAAWAQIGLAKSLAHEAAEHGTSVSVVCPATLDTEMTADPAYWASIQAGRDGRTTVTEVSRDQGEHLLRVRHPSHQTYTSTGAVVRSVIHLLAEPGLEMTGAVIDVSAGLAATNTA